MKRLLIVPIGILAVAACSDATGSAGNAPMAMSFSTSSPAAAPSVGSNGLSYSISDASGALVINDVQLVLNKIELKADATASCPEEDRDGAHDDDCAEVKAGPVLVDLPLDPGVAGTINLSVPQGTYTRTEFKVGPAIEGKAGGTAFLQANPGFAGISVRVEGTFNGTAFVYTSPLEAEMELAFGTPVSVDATGLNLTINVDVLGWFTTAGGAIIDPNTAINGGVNEELVAQNIRASFHAFEDEDRDGHDDHGGDSSIGSN